MPRKTKAQLAAEAAATATVEPDETPNEPEPDPDETSEPEPEANEPDETTDPDTGLVVESDPFEGIDPLALLARAESIRSEIAGNLADTLASARNRGSRAGLWNDPNRVLNLLYAEIHLRKLANQNRAVRGLKATAKGVREEAGIAEPQ